MRKIISLVFCALSFLQGEKPHISCHLKGQLGNQMFQVAAASALAWDHGVDVYFPDLMLSRGNLINNYKNVFYRCLSKSPKKISKVWKERGCGYTKIPYTPFMQISGYLQSEKYFKHHKKRIIGLFSPKGAEQQYIKKKYPFLQKNQKTVGVQIRNQRVVKSNPKHFPTYGRDFYEKAMKLFPQDSLFVVTSNDLKFAKQCLANMNKNIIFIEDEPYHLDLYILSLCKHNIISNSTFGWWGAWLNQNPNKIVVCPQYLMKSSKGKLVLPKDYIPPEWKIVKSKHSIDN